MTREEFESILEEAYMEGYNTAISDIQEDILDEEAYDLEGEYDYYTESKNVRNQMDKLNIDKGEALGTTNGELWRDYRPRNPKRNWVKFSDSSRNREDRLRGNIADAYYTVKNTDPRARYTSVVRGRIKSGEFDSDDPRSNKLKEKAAANAERRKAELRERLRPFKNKGNKY